MNYLFIHPLTVYNSKGVELKIDARSLVNITDIQRRDYVSLKFKYDGKTYWTFRDDLLKSIHGDCGYDIDATVAFPGFTIYLYKQMKTVQVLRVREDELILDGADSIEPDSLDYAVVRNPLVQLPLDKQYVLRNDVHAFHKMRIIKEDELDKFELYLSKFDKIAFDSETTGLLQDMYKLDDREDFLVSISVSTDASSGFYIKASKSQRFRDFITFLCTKHLIIHNATFDIGMLKGVYNVTPAKFDDTLVMAKLMNENLLTYRLKDLATQILGRGKQLKLAEFDYLGYLHSNNFERIEYILAYYAAADTANTYGIYNYIQPKLSSQTELYEYYQDIELASIIPVSIAISENGLTVDTEALTTLSVDSKQYLNEQLGLMHSIVQPYLDKMNVLYLKEQQQAKDQYWSDLLLTFETKGVFKSPLEVDITKEMIYDTQHDSLPPYNSVKNLVVYHNRIAGKPKGDCRYTLDLSNKKFMELLVYLSPHGFRLPHQKSATGKLSLNKTAISEIEKYLHAEITTGNTQLEQVQQFFNAFKEYTKTRKLLDAFITPTLEGIGEFKDNKLHASYNLLGTVSSRASCSNPNFQQLSNNKQFDIRKCFIVEDREKYSFLQFDLTLGQLKLCELLETLTIKLQAISSQDLECETLVL